MERALLCFNSHHIHRGRCIEGTSMHLNCLHDQRKAVSSSRKREKRFKNVWMTGTRAHTPTHTCTQRKTKNTTSKHTHFAKHRCELMCMVKHTEQHPKDLTSQSVRGWRTPAAGEPLQRTLAEKQHPPLGGSSSEKAEKSSVLDQWLLWAVPQGNENHFFLLSGSALLCKSWRMLGRPRETLSGRVLEKCREFTPWTCLSADDDCYHVKRIVWHCGKWIYCRFGSQTWGWRLEMKQELAGSHRRPYLMQIKALDHELWLTLLTQFWFSNNSVIIDGAWTKKLES